jgi:hypothetical protein
MSVVLSSEQEAVCSHIVLNVLVYFVVSYYRYYGRIVKRCNRRNEQNEVLRNMEPGFGIVKS